MCSSDLEDANTIKINGSTLKLTEEQTGYVSFSGISTHEEKNPWSNRVEIKIDKTPPEITIDPETEEREDYKTIVLRFSDDKSGVSYYQVTNDNIEPTNWINKCHIYCNKKWNILYMDKR